MRAEYLRFIGFGVDTALDGGDALQKTTEQPPDVLVLDLTMSGLTGWEVAAGLRADAQTKHVRIIVVTGHGVAGAEAMPLRTGVDAYLVKPCPEVLAEAVGLQLRHWT